MTIRFDTLSFAKRLTEAGEKPEIAEAHALAFKDFVMDHLATKDDLLLTREDLRGEIGSLGSELRGEMAALGKELRGEMAALGKELRGEMAALGKELRGEMAALGQELRGEITLLRKETHASIDLLRKDLETMGLKLTVRMGGMLAVAVGMATALHKVL